MKTLLSITACCFCLGAESQTKYSGYPNTNTVPGNFLILWAQPGVTNWNQTYDQFRTQLGLSGISNFTFLTIGGATYTTNAWLGPTNSITLGSTNHYFYKAVTPCAVTGFVYNATLSNPSVLTIS